MKERKLNIGWAQCSITPHQPRLMEGQMYPRVSRYVHDPITATALVLENGETQAIFVSMDMTEVPNHAMAPLQAALAECEEIKFENISFKMRTGDRVALIGPNGVGKSTLFKILVNQLAPERGSVKYGTNIDLG